MKDFVDPGWRDTLRRNGLLEFVDIWRVDAGWFEPLNRRRGGWSGVSRCRVEREDGQEAWLFLKRQEDHVHRTLLHPWRGVPTLVREMRNIRNYRRCGIPTLVPVLFASQRIDGHRRVVLITEELTGFRSLEDMEAGWETGSRPPRRERLEVAYAVADLLARMHAHGLQHNCFYPKHVLLRRRKDGGWEVRVIDLEKTKRPLVRRRAQVRDLSTLSRHARGWSRSERLRFFLRYLGEERLASASKRLLRWVLRDIGRKTGGG